MSRKRREKKRRGKNGPKSTKKAQTRRRIAYEFAQPTQVKQTVDIIKDGKLVSIAPKVPSNEIKDISRTLFYDRDSGKPKIISSESGLSQHQATLLEDDELCDYTLCIAIDTNTRKSNGDVFSVAVAAPFKVVRNGNCLKNYYYSAISIEFHNAPNPENYAWYTAIEMLAAHNVKPLENESYALIVDSGLSNLQSFNRRSSPIWGNYVLPRGYKLIYASGDSTNRNKSIKNAMVTLCDKTCKTILDKIWPNISGHKIKCTQDNNGIWHLFTDNNSEFFKLVDALPGVKRVN